MATAAVVFTVVAGVVQGAGAASASAATGPGVPAAAPDSTAVTPIPAADSGTSSPGTGIVLRGTRSAPSAVVGDRSGEHPGSITVHPDGEGVTFQPDEPFIAGETVTVSTDQPVTGAADGSYTFTVATPAEHPGMEATGELAGAADADTGDPTAGTAAATQAEEPAAVTAAAATNAVTRPDLRLPQVTVNTPASGTAPGYLMATAYNTASGDDGPLIYDNDGQVVWFRPAPANKVVGDLKAADFNGRRVLTWFEGTPPYGAGSYRGEWVVVDDTYTELARIRMGNGYQADIHDIDFTDHGTVYLLGYNPLRCDNVTVTGCRTGVTVLETVVQEVDPGSGSVLFEWHSLDHVPTSDSIVSSSSTLFDYIHANSLDVDLDGNVLMSGRNTSALYKIDRQTGEVIFIFGGEQDQFTYDDPDDERVKGPDYQHDFEVRPDGTYSYFDNGNRRRASRGAVVSLDNATKTAEYLKDLRHTPISLLGPTQGRMQNLPDDHQLVAWGGLGVVTEFDAANNVIFEASLAGGTYRQQRFDWVGRPTTLPAVDIRPAGSAGVDLRVSWNGDTRTMNWRVLAGASPETLQVVETVPKDGFETVASISASGPYFRVEALDTGGVVVGRGKTARVGSTWFDESTSRSVNGSYQPLIGDFGGSRNDDIFYYAPGSAGEYLHISTGDGGFSSLAANSVNGTFQPLIGDFVGDDRDEILWWRPNSTSAQMWRFDRQPRTSLAIRPQLGTIAVPGGRLRPMVLDHRPMFGGSKDEILWYGAGSTPDRVDRYTWDSRQPLTRHGRSISVNGSYRPVVGDYDGNGFADVLWYARGSVPDSIWFNRGNASGSTGYRTAAVTINGLYDTVVGNFSGMPDRDEVLFWAPGSTGDSLWSFNSAGSVTSRNVTSNGSGSAIRLRGGQDTVAIWNADSPRIGDLSNGRNYFGSQNAAVGSGYQPLVGDFVGPGGSDSILWYRPGSSPERLYARP